MKGYSIPQDFPWIENCKGCFSRDSAYLGSLAQNEQKFVFQLVPKIFIKLKDLKLYILISETQDGYH